MREIFVGIDLGGTNIKIGCFDTSLKLLCKTAVATKADMGAEVVVEKICETAKKLLADNDMQMGDIDVVEINEAFASVVLAWEKELKPDMATVNPNGGAIALGHPLGGTGAILLTKAVHELNGIEPAGALIMECLGRKEILGERIFDELSIIEQLIPDVPFINALRDQLLDLSTAWADAYEGFLMEPGKAARSALPLHISFATWAYQI